jgi:sensor domain CHASE-containing protein
MFNFLSKSSVRIKVLSSTLAFLVIVALIQTFLNLGFFVNALTNIEQQDVINEVQKVEGLFNDQIANLLIKDYDWAIWDDAYKFIQDKNQDFIDSNLQNGSLNNINLNYMLFFSQDQKLIYGKGIDRQTNQQIPVTPNMVNLLNKPISDAGKSDTSYASGIINLPQGVMLFAVRPILHSNGSGPVNGTVTFGRYIDKEIISHIARLNISKIEIMNYDSANLPADFKEVKALISSKGIKVKDPNEEEKDSYYVKNLNSNSISGYTIMKDYYGNPSFILKVILPRPIYALGSQVIQFSAFITVILTLITLGLALWLINVLIISKITKLSSEVNQVTDYTNPKQRLTVAGEDEFASVAVSINNMLDEITKSEGSYKKQSEELTKQVTNLEKFQRLTIDRELKMIELKKRIAELESSMSKNEK